MKTTSRRRTRRRTKTTAPMLTMNMVKRKPRRRERRNHNRHRRHQDPKVCTLGSFSGALQLNFCIVISRNNDSDSDSEYGSRSKKKKRPRASGDEIRVSSRGGKIPNYTDDVQALAELSEEEVDEGYYVDLTAQKEEDEIESVLSHCRDEGHED